MRRYIFHRDEFVNALTSTNEECSKIDASKMDTIEPLRLYTYFMTRFLEPHTGVGVPFINPSFAVA
jgi:hypothetical protein